MVKKCFKCNSVKPLTEFYKHPDMPDGTVNKCKECNKKDNQQNWHKNSEKKNAYKKNRYRFCIQTYFRYRYSSIRWRCTGNSVKRTYKVTGSNFLTREEWNDWCYDIKNYKTFMELYIKWVESGFDTKLSPSIDRINNDLGYTKDNLQWLSKSENSKKYNKLV